MKKSYLIGVDAGVSFVKAGVYDVNGNCVGAVKKCSPEDYPCPGVFIQENEVYLSTVLNALKEAVEKSGIDGSNVEAVGFSSAMGGATGIDKDWNTVTDWSIISDTRYYPYVTEMQEAAGDRIRKLSGTNFPIFAPKLIWWKKDFPEAYKKVRKFMFLSGYLVGKLCDIPIEDAYADRTFMQISSLADIVHERWSDELCEEFDIDKDLLPKIVESHDVVGRLSSKFAGICGLKAGTPFVAGMGDKPAGSLGAGLLSPGVLIDESASFGALSLCVDNYVPDVEHNTLENMPSPVKGYYFPCFFLFGSGVTHAWFKDNFGAEELAEASGTEKSAFDLLDEKAAGLSPGSDGLLSVSLLGGRGYPSDPDIKGMWIGYTWSHRKEHFYRSMLESFAYEYGFVLNVMKKNYPEIDFNEVRVIGGGARSGLWNQMKCDVTGLTYTKLTRDDFTLLGDVLIAGHAAGIYEDLKEASQKFVKKDKQYLPDGENHELYKKYVQCYSNIFDRIRDIYVDLKNIEDK